MSLLQNLRCFLLLLLVACFPARAGDAPSSTAARTVFEQARDAVVKVRSTVADNNNSTGTAFLLRADGLMVTNYHVVSDHVFDPAIYQLRYQTHDGREGPLTLLAIDVVNDLALVKSDLTTPKPLRLRTSPPEKGDTAFSLGYPLNQGITVTEGTFNGISEDFYREHFHFTGAVNPGMSGGPVVDRAGEVIGMNVSHRRNAQLVSFLVPGRFIAALLESAASGKPPASFEHEAWSQAGAHTANLLRDASAATWQSRTLGNFTLPAEQMPRMQCSRSVSNEATEKTESESVSCTIKSSLYLTDRLMPGQLSVSHTLYRNRRLPAPQFARFIQAQFGVAASAMLKEKDYKPMQCMDRIVALKGGRFKAVLCAAAYRRHSQLNDTILRVLSLTDGKEAVITKLDIDGAPPDAALPYIERFLGSLQWNPNHK